MAKIKTGYPSKDRNHEEGESLLARKPIIPYITIYNLARLLNMKNKSKIETLSLEIGVQELFQHAKILSKSLSELGYKKGDILTTCMPNNIQHLAVILAANRIGVAVAPLNDKSSVPEITKYINDFESKAFMGYNLSEDTINSIKKECNIEALINMPTENNSILWNPESSQRVLGWDPIISYDDFVRLSDYYKGRVIISFDGNKVAFYQFTSGTTGEPKIVEITDKNVVASAIYMMNGAKTTIESDGKCLVIVHFSYPYGLPVSALMSLFSRRSILLAPDITAKNISDYMERRPTIIYGTPPFLYALCKDEKVAKMDLSFIDLLLSGGGPISVAASDEITDFVRSCGAKVFLRDGSGTAETSATGTTAVNRPYRPDTVGWTLTGTIITAVDPLTFEELPYGERGLLAYIGKHVVSGYYNNPQETKKHFVKGPNGKRMFVSDTYGRVNSDGTVEMYGRATRDFITFDEQGGSYKCEIFKVENFVSEFEEVLYCALVPKKDELRENVGKLYVVLKRGIDATEELKDRLLAKCHQRIKVIRNGKEVEQQLRSYEIPTEIEFLDSLPLTVASKIDYKLLEELANSNEKPRIRK